MNDRIVCTNCGGWVEIDYQTGEPTYCDTCEAKREAVVRAAKAWFRADSLHREARADALRSAVSRLAHARGGA